MDKSWMCKSKVSNEYAVGLKGFLDFAFQGRTLKDSNGNDTIRCPCNECLNHFHKPRHVVENHLYMNGILQSYTNWIHQGEEFVAADSRSSNRNVDQMQEIVYDVSGAREWNGEDEVPNVEARKFYSLLEECKKSLYPGCQDYSKMSYTVELLHIKSLYRVSNAAMNELMRLFKNCLPQENTAPGSYSEAKKIVSDLGLKYEKIDACKNDCILFTKEHADAAVCPVCSESRWAQVKEKVGGDSRNVENRRNVKKVPVKRLRYFPLIPRLQRYFMSTKTASSMRWHADGRIKDGVMRHPADSVAWKALDDVRPEFGAEPRNIRLGLSSDGFNPFSNKPYSVWPVLLIPYNLPPQECMKDPNYLLSMIIPGPKSPGNDIDVYLQPLVDELKLLWEEGVMTYDASKKENFRLYAAIIWTINDFPAYGNLSGWATSGYLACPVCNKDTCSCRLPNGSKISYMDHRRYLPNDHQFRFNRASFNGKQDFRPPPRRKTGDEVLKQLESLENICFGKLQKTNKIGLESPSLNWKKRSVFFQLSYWKSLLLPHNLDVMHIEKNVCENLLNTLLGVKGRSNDNLNARLDMQVMGIRHSLHPISNGSKHVIPAASHTLLRDQKTLLCRFLADLTIPGGLSSNISRCVNVKERKIDGLKSHDYHVLMQRLLPIAVRGVLPKHVVKTLVMLSNAFRVLCSKELGKDDLDRLERDMPIIMCNLERIFPPAFFNVSMHLEIHLVYEAKIAGPVQFRWMYFVERIMGIMKSFVRNRRHPEASMAEGYIALECMTFCSRYLQDVETRFTRISRNYIGNSQEQALSIFQRIGRPLGASTVRELSMEERFQCHSYILNQCEEVQPFIDEHKRMLRGRRLNPRAATLAHNKEFPNWFEDRVTRMHGGRVNAKIEHLKSLASKPLFSLKCYSGYEVNGYKFHTKERASRRIVQNCGVITSADTTCFSSARDRNPQSSSLDYYGVVKEIVEVPYLNSNSIVLFKCDWFDVVNRRNVRYDEFGFTSVKTSASLQTNEPYILAYQARQVFYAKDPMDEEWSVVVDVEPRKHFNMGLHMLAEGVEPHQDTISLYHPLQLNPDVGDFEHNRVDVVSDEVEAHNTVGVETIVEVTEVVEDDEVLGEDNGENEEEEYLTSDEETDDDMNEDDFDESASNSTDSKTNTDACSEDDE